MNTRLFVLPVCVLLAALAFAAPCSAKSKTGILALRVTPKQAYVFIDAKALDEGGGLYRSTPGEHTIELHNYGYKSLTQKFTIQPGKVTKLSLQLEPAPGDVSGPWGRIQLEGQPHSVVLLNGKTLDFFVGHVDEFDNEIIWKQQLLVPPGTHQITVLRHYDNKEIYSGPVTVKPNERVIVYLNRNGEQTRKAWKRGEMLKTVPRFKAGLASTTVAVGPVTADLSVTPAKINCGEPAQLSWTTSGVTGAEITGIGPVAVPSGQQTVQPKETTTYKLMASGTGGMLEPTATVTVNREIDASLSITPEEVHYRRVGDKVIEQPSATISWTASGAQSISIDSLGTVSPTGSQAIQITPKRREPGPIDETVSYTLTTMNACGISASRTAALHITGSIMAYVEGRTPTETALEISLALNSVYFPTAQPTQGNSNGGLVPSQQRILSELAGNFKKYFEFRPDAHLILQAHADKRGSVAYNKALSERRADRVRAFLTAKGVPPASLQTVAFGKERNLQEEAVRQLQEQNPTISAEQREKLARNMSKLVLANNRRVDIVLSTTGQQSKRFLPHNVPDADEIIEDKTETSAKKTARPKPKAKPGRKKAA